jgi:hypothetical protein
MQCPNCGHEVAPRQELCFRCGQGLTSSPARARWLVPAGRIFSCPVMLHKTTILALVLLVLLELYASKLQWEHLLGFAAWLLMWACVVFVHELGHILSIRVQRLSCRHAIIFPLPLISVQGWGIGGSERQRAAVALAGPVSSLAAALVLLPLVPVFPDSLWPVALCAAHAMVGAFNLLPIEPLDGSVIFRRSAPLLSRPEAAPPPEPVEAEELFPEAEDLDRELEELDFSGAPNVDQILEKILASGMDSLTEQERTILQQASRHLRR